MATSFHFDLPTLPESLAVAPCKLNDYMFDDLEDDNALRNFTCAGMW
jgi:hypothetical protein